ncbi:MAG: DUF3857 and transglutaminase domain-containing protein [Bacteroidales bacterium]|nr:DUF3857 and transglutaminase domain-containing protein [Bacteroidales bacterium]
MKKGFILLFLIGFGYSALATDPIPGLISNAGTSTNYPRADLLVVFDSTITQVRETGLSYVWNHTLYKVLTTQGAKELSVLVFGYDPQSAYVEIQHLTIYRADGQQEEVDVSGVMDYPAPARAIYWGAREKMIEVGRLEPGDAIDVVMFRKGFTYALLFEDDDRYIPPMRGHFYDIVEFFGPNPVKEKVYQVSLPLTKTLQFEFYNGEVGISGWKEGDAFVYTFTKKELLPVEREPGMVALSDVAPKLLLSTSPDWYAKSIWFYGVNEDFGSFETTPEITAKVNEILRDAKTEEDSISLLTHWCADEIRYSGISMGEGEGFTLHTGDMTFTDRCGVCKDKAGMLITMLRAAGFESYAAMTMAGSRIDLIPADQFNHSVTVVKRGNGEYQLLDPTWVPFIRELWSSAEQQQQYLMGLPEGADLATTPISDPQNHFVEISGTSSLLADGTLTGSLTITAEGQSDAALRNYFRYSGKPYWDQVIERELLRLHPNCRIEKVNYGDPMDYLNNPVTIVVEYTIPDYAIVAGNTLFFTPLLARNPFQNTQSHLNMNTNPDIRKYPFRDRCSRFVSIRETILLPENESIIRIPASIDHHTDIASMAGGYTLDGNTLIFEETITLGKRIYEPSEWQAVKTVVENQKRFAEQSVILTLAK